MRGEGGGGRLGQQRSSSALPHADLKSIEREGLLTIRWGFRQPTRARARAPPPFRREVASLLDSRSGPSADGITPSAFAATA